jgi:hypothetical protein
MAKYTREAVLGMTMDRAVRELAATLLSGFNADGSPFSLDTYRAGSPSSSSSPSASRSPSASVSPSSSPSHSKSPSSSASPSG